MKTINFIDEESQKLVQYQCKNRVDKSKYNEFINFLYTRKLDSNLSSVKLLKDGKTTFDLIKEFNQLLDAQEEIIDFGGVLSTFSSPELYQMQVVKEPIKRFLSLFEFESRKELPMNDFIVMSLFSKHPNFEGTEEAKQAIKVVTGITNNSKVLKNNSFEKTMNLSKNTKNRESFVLTKQITSISSANKAAV